MEKLVQLSIVSLSPSNLGSNSFILLLKSNENPNAIFPIVIGPNEAQSISVFLENIEMPRPLTHQLLSTILDKSNIKIDKILINDFRDGIFYSIISFEGENGKFEIDARPSDGIAMAVKNGQPIYIKQELLDQICLKSEDSDFDEISDSEENEYDVPVNSSGVDVTQLNNQLQSALEREDYEAAAKIRDQINSLSNK